MCRSTIRDKIIPHAVSWFTGEAVQGDDEFEDIEEDAEDDEEGDEDEDEDEEDDDDDDEEEEKGGKSRKKVILNFFQAKFKFSLYPPLCILSL